MSSLRSHLEARAAQLADCAAVEIRVEDNGFEWVTLRPTNPAAAPVQLFVGWEDRVGTVGLVDPACIPAELGEDPDEDRRAIDYFVDVAVEGRATAFHFGRGGAVELRHADGSTFRCWNNACWLPGWRGRATKVEFAPYRAGVPG